MNENVTLSDLKCTLSPYGYPIATFSPVKMTISRRTVIVHAIIWDADYNNYRAIGNYAKKDGSRGAQIAKPLMGNAEVPSEIHTNLLPFRT